MKQIKNLRLKSYDYKSNAFYFITILSNYKQPFTDEEKEIIIRNINNIKSVNDKAYVDYYELVNNHLHMILVLDDCNMKLSEIIRRFKAKCSKDTGRKLWHPNYYEHVIRSDKALIIIREYIKNNPLKERLDFSGIYGKVKVADESANTRN